MTPLEHAILDAVRRTKKEGLEPSSVYLRPEDIEALGGPTEIGGLKVKRLTAKGRPRLYTSRGLARAISVPKRQPAPTYTDAQRLFLVSLLHGWPVHGLDVDRRLRGRGLVAGRPATRRLKGRDFEIEEPRLTGAGEEEAQRLWGALDRAGRARLREQAMKAGL